MRLIFVHGINHQGKNSQWIIDEWLKVLQGALSPADFALVNAQEIEAPFYGDILYRLTQEKTATQDKLQPQSADTATGDEAAFYRDALTEIVAANPGLATADLLAETEVVVAQDAIYNNRYLIALLKVLEKVLPDRGAALLKILPQAFTYLNRIQATEAVDEVVRPAFEKGRCIVVAHSLGTIVAFKLMRELKQDCPFFLTMGSPLGIKAVQGPLRVPFGRRAAVAAWRNAWDPDDVVTLSKPLDDATFGAGVDNNSVENGYDDAHDFHKYLGHKVIAQALADAIRQAQ